MSVRSRVGTDNFTRYYDREGYQVDAQGVRVDGGYRIEIDPGYTSNIDDTERTGTKSLTIGQVISKLYEMIQSGHEPDEPLLLGNSGYTLTVVGERDGKVYIG